MEGTLAQEGKVEMKERHCRCRLMWSPDWCHATPSCGGGREPDDVNATRAGIRSEGSAEDMELNLKGLARLTPEIDVLVRPHSTSIDATQWHPDL